MSNNIARDEVADRIGTALSKLHAAKIVHGDLTTSNLMIREKTNSLVCIYMHGEDHGEMLVLVDAVVQCCCFVCL